MPRGVPALTVALAGIGLAAAVAGGRIGHPPAVPSLLTQVLLLLALALAGRLTVAYRHRGEVDALDVFEAALTPAVALVPGLRVVLLVVVAKAIAQLWLRMPATKLAFNVAQWTACAGLASVVYAALSQAGTSASERVPALAIAMIVAAAANLASVAGLFALLPGAPVSGQVFSAAQLLRSLVMTTVTVAIGIATARAAQDNRGALIALFGLLVLLHWAGRGYALQGAHSDQWRWLQRATHTLSASVDPRESLTAFLGDVCRCCNAQSAELALRRNGDPEIYRVGAEPGSPPAVELLDAELPLHVVAMPGTARWQRAFARLLRRPPGAADQPIAPQGGKWRDCLAVPVRTDDLRIGVLAVYNRTGLAELDSADSTALEALAHELSTALQRAELIDQAISARASAERIIAGSSDGIVAIAEDGAVVAWNPALAELTGRPAEHMIGEQVSVLEARDAAGRPVPLETWAEGRELPAELQIRAEDGRRRWVSCSYAQETDRRQRGRMLVVIVRDVTELRRHRALITGQAEILELIASDEPASSSLEAIVQLIADQLDGADVAVVSAEQMSDEEPLLARTDPPVAASSGAFPTELSMIASELWAEEQPRELSPVAFTLPEDGGDATYWAMPVAQDEDARARAVILVRPHRAAPLSDYAVEVLRTAGRLTDVCLSRDETRARLAHQSSHDPLTGLPNRAVFLDRCLQAVRAQPNLDRAAVVLFVDLDQFKVVNDSLGHEVGDRLLVAVAERLRHALRPSDTIARFGGDEFTILCEAVREEDARVLAERLLALFDSPFRIDDMEVFETASIGIAVGTRASRPVDLLQQADAAMYRAKDGGGNRYAFFDARIGRRASARLASYTALRRAVDEEQFQVQYQPMVRIDDGTLAGMEALVRWDHPRGELLPPKDFIDLAEETGLIVPLGAFVLRTALLAMPRLSVRAEQPTRISVNVSARQLASPQFVPTVRRALQDSGVAAHLLSLEITESVLLTRSSAVYGVINDLRTLGVGLSLDDFGTGHSSLDYLRRVPVDELKIDRRFIAELTTSNQCRAIVSAVIHLAHELGLRVVAEGIEHAGQVDALTHLGCDLAQGFYYSPPLPAEELLRHSVGTR